MLTYEHHYDLETALERTDYELFRNGDYERKSSQQRLYTYHELCGVLKRAGFTACRGYSSPNGQPLRASLQRLLLVATKAGPRPLEPRDLPAQER